MKPILILIFATVCQASEVTLNTGFKLPLIGCRFPEVLKISNFLIKVHFQWELMAST